MIGGFAECVLAERSLTDHFERFHVEWIGAGLEVDQEAQLLVRRLLAAAADTLAAGDVDRDWLGDVHVASRFHGQSRLLGMEIGGSLDHHRIERLLEHSFVPRQAAETAFGRNAELVPRTVHSIREIVGRRYNVVTAVFLEQIQDPRPAPTAARDADIDFLIGGISADGLRLDDRDGDSRRTGSRQKASSRQLISGRIAGFALH